jgi:hypothetical protein
MKTVLARCVVNTVVPNSCAAVYTEQKYTKLAGSGSINLNWKNQPMDRIALVRKTLLVSKMSENEALLFRHCLIQANLSDLNCFLSELVAPLLWLDQML